VMRLKVLAVALAIASPMTLQACNPGGEVVGHRAVCHAEGTQQEICDWQIKTRDQGTTSDWFSVARQTWDRCQVGELYPKCGDNR
jgi:hypothetical protein